MKFFLIPFIIFISPMISSGGGPPEHERVELWYERGNVWPPNWQPETEEFKKVMNDREMEIMNLSGADERWENWMQFTQSRLLPRFTDVGFDIIDTPPHIHAKLSEAVHAGIKEWDKLPYEQGVDDSIYGPEAPKFVDITPIDYQVLDDLKELHEQWVDGMKLKGTSAYGVRLYVNGSSIVMHYDKPHTHVISSIVHIAHQYDNNDEPWPIEIEDHNGQLHAVALEEGQMLFYESSVCLHGRSTALKGKYYGSIFLHYMPAEKGRWGYTVDDVIANVPPHWKDGVNEEHGSRWAGQAITVDSRVVAGAPERAILTDVDSMSGTGDQDDQDFYNDLDDNADL